ncbi:hypothetical protein GW813_01295 [bacterium]|nr:hypothetical protein [bacterium]PIV81034.1 MAG: hypothetical protein COW53_06545 [bacterium CG17_big_fil_post_rev_8_21_14_2_50_64_8]PJA73712.1 MAG: hypothetical protein CO151_12410 [bacterium CG_4_9_14_3_um_filter_65_15]
MIRKSVLMLGLVGLLVVPTGCIFSPPGDNNPIIDIKPTLVFPDTPAKLMANFKTIYENMDYNAYQTLLHPDYLTILQASTTSDFPEVGTTLDYTEEMDIANHMFSGAAGHDSKGDLTTPISSITLQEPTQLTSWETSPGDDPIPNAESALFDVYFEFSRAGDKTLKVTGQIKFYITSHDSLHQGSMKPYYQMIGQYDLTNDG